MSGWITFLHNEREDALAFFKKIGVRILDEVTPTKVGDRLYDEVVVKVSKEAFEQLESQWGRFIWHLDYSE